MRHINKMVLFYYYLYTIKFGEICNDKVYATNEDVFVDKSKQEKRQTNSFQLTAIEAKKLLVRKGKKLFNSSFKENV